MPRKTGYKHLQKTRDKIRATQLVNRLLAHINADEPILDATQVNAAKTLLNKVLPDLRSTELTGPEGGPISFDKSVIEVVHTKATDTSETATNSDRPEALE